MKIELLEKERYEEYSQFLLKDDRVNFNSSLTFKQLLESITGAEPYYLIALENNKIIGSLPSFLKINKKYGNVLNSLPWYGSNPGITVDPTYPDRQQVKMNLIGAFNELAREKKSLTSTIITRNFELDLEIYEQYTKYDFLDKRVGLITPLPKFSGNIENDLMTMIHSKTRNLVRKAQKTGIKFYHDNSKETLHFLVNTHTKNMQEVGAPPKGETLFNEVTRLFKYDQEYRIYIAEFEGVKIGALLLKYFSKTVDYFTPAIVAEYRSYQPLSILIFNAMKDASEKGFRYWNWGGTTLPSQEGVYHFKKRWGSDECQYHYYTRSYSDISHILNLKPETLLKEYPYFYVLPFSKLIIKT